MSNEYLSLKQKHQKEVENFPMAFAFSNKRLKEGMEKLGLTQTDTDKMCSIGSGCFIRKSDSKALSEMFNRQDRELKEAIDNDIKGDGFIFDMFYYELSNHEYAYTRELEPTLDALGLTIDEINASDKLLYGLKKACMEQK